MLSEDAVAQQLRQGGSKRAPQADGDQNDHVADHVGRCALEDLDDGHVKQLLADFFQLFDGAQPLSVIFQLFPLACYSRGQPAGCPLAFTVTWPFLPLVVSAYAFATISCISLISSAVQMPSVTHWSYTDCTAVWKAFSSSAEGS